MTKLLIHHINQIKHHKMTKDRILLLDSYISFYTLGALTDDSDDVLVLNQTLYDGTFPLKDLVSKSFDVKSFEKSVSFNIYNTTKLSKLRKPAMPYKLQVGSSVRYKNKTYQVIGYYYNQFAQLNIISPILFNPSNVVTDVANLFYGLKSNKEVIDIINDNFVAGKYSNDIVFPLTVGVKNYKKQLSNIQAPPFTSLDSLTVKKKEEIKVGEPLIPYEFDTNQLNKEQIKRSLQKYADANRIEQSDIDFYADINSFSDSELKRIPNDEDFKDFTHPMGLYKQEYNKHLSFGGGGLPLLPYNLITSSKLLAMSKKDDIFYQTPIGNIYPLLRMGFLGYRGDYFTNQLSKDYFFGIFVSKSNRIYYNDIIRNLLFTKAGKNKYEIYVNDNSKDFIDRIETDLYPTQSSLTSTDNYSLKENTSYGGFYATSGTPKLNGLTDVRILPFGTVFKKNGIYYYVLSYLNSDIESNTHCFCVKTSDRSSTFTVNLNARTLTEMRSTFKKFTTDEVFRAFKKEGHIFDIDDSYYSLPQSAETIKEREKDTSNPTLVTDVFLDKRAEQFEVLQSNFPKLSNTFLGILSVLDKSLSKPKLKELIQEKGLVYLSLKSSDLESNINRRGYNSDENNRFSNLLKKVAERKIEDTKSMLNAKGGENISKEIKNLAVDTSKTLIGESDVFYVALKSYEDFQKYAVVRTAINLYDNFQLYELNERRMWNSDKIAFPMHNLYSSLSLDCFLGTMPNMYVSGISNQESPNDINFYLRGKSYGKVLQLPVFTNEENMNSRLYLYSQFIFVYSALQVLYKNAHRVLASQVENTYEDFIENSNFIRELKQYDLSLPLKYMVKNEMIRDLQLAYGIKTGDYFRFNEKQKKLYDLFSYNFIFRGGSEEDLIEFETLLRELDKLYGGVFQLEEKIINNKSQSLFVNFPKVKAKESIISQEYELLKDYKEKGYLLISNSEENEMLIDYHNDLVDEETGDVISLGIDKNETYVISSNDEQTERWRSYGFLDEKPNDIEEDEFDDTDLFEDAFEELGDEFLENIEELDIDELI